MKIGTPEKFIPGGFIQSLHLINIADNSIGILNAVVSLPPKDDQTILVKIIPTVSRCKTFVYVTKSKLVIRFTSYR